MNLWNNSLQDTASAEESMGPETSRFMERKKIHLWCLKNKVITSEQKIQLTAQHMFGLAINVSIMGPNETYLPTAFCSRKLNPIRLFVLLLISSTVCPW